MLIAYVFCIYISERRFSFIISMVIGSVIFGAGALMNVLGGTNYILNACSMLALHFLFILVSFRMDITTSAFYTIFWFEQVHTGSGYMSYWLLCDNYGNTAQWVLRTSADLLPRSCSMKNGKYIQYSRIFHTFARVKISRRISLPHYAVLP